jgi:hypothetical protein
MVNQNFKYRNVTRAMPTLHGRRCVKYSQIRNSSEIVGPNFAVSAGFVVKLWLLQASHKHQLHSSAPSTPPNSSSPTATMGLGNKRKRSDGDSKRPKKHAPSSKRQKNNAGKRVVGVDSLPWKTVELPEMFDDAEGFYGLEEVHGVEVVKEGGTVKFVSASVGLQLGSLTDKPPGGCCS